MVKILSMVAPCALAFALIATASPVAEPQAQPSAAANNNVTADDVNAATVQLDPILDPASKPIDAGSNSTLVAAVPAVAAPVENHASVIASISAASATGSPTTLNTVPAATSVAPAATESADPASLDKRRVPPKPANYRAISCNNYHYPYASALAWKYAIARACNAFFPSNGNLVFLYEGTSRGVSVIVPFKGFFHFRYHVRTSNAVPYSNWHPMTNSICIAELESRVFWSLFVCRDNSGMSSKNDVNNAIWWEASSPK